MKAVLWLFAVVGTLYFLMYSTGTEVVIRYAVGPFMLAMFVAPLVLGLLILWSFARRFGLLNKEWRAG